MAIYKLQFYLNKNRRTNYALNTEKPAQNSYLVTAQKKEKGWTFA
jgi:hypothetical protein